MLKLSREVLLFPSLISKGRAAFLFKLPARCSTGSFKLMAKKRDQIILTPKSKREFYLMTTFIAYLEPLVRKLLKKYRKLPIYTVWDRFPDEFEKRGINPKF